MHEFTCGRCGTHLTAPTLPEILDIEDAHRRQGCKPQVRIALAAVEGSQS